MKENTAFDALMHELCVGLGFCGCIKDSKPLHITRIVPSRGPVTADQFTDWVFLAEDLNPNSTFKNYDKLRRQIRAAFVRHMGAEVVDATRLRWVFPGVEPAKHAESPIYQRIEVWRRNKDGQAIRYNCVQYLWTGEYRVCTADIVAPDNAHDKDQVRYFVEAFLDSEPVRGELTWSSTLEGAIADHDAAFGNT